MGFWVVVVASVLLLFLWGLLSPRSQWRVLSAWSYRDPRSSEPGAVAFGMRRIISGIGIIFFAALGIGAAADFLAALPTQQAPPTPVQQMWGPAPAPQVVDRVVQPLTTVPAGLADLAIAGYQIVDNETHEPRYLHLLAHFEPGGIAEVSGYIGTAPARNTAALESAELVVNVHGWVQCIPRAAVVLEAETTVQVGIFYGQPGVTDAIVDSSVCEKAPFVQNSLLVPLTLATPLGERQLQDLDGAPIKRVLPID